MSRPKPYERHKPPTHGVGGGVVSYRPDDQSGKLFAPPAKPTHGIGTAVISRARGGQALPISSKGILSPERQSAIAALIATKKRLLGRG